MQVKTQVAIFGEEVVVTMFGDKYVNVRKRIVRWDDFREYETHEKAMTSLNNYNDAVMEDSNKTHVFQVTNNNGHGGIETDYVRIVPLSMPEESDGIVAGGAVAEASV